MNRITALLACAIFPAIVLTGGWESAHAVGQQPFECNGTFTGQEFHNVVVLDGATCIIVDSVVTGNIHTRGAPKVVKIIDTPVGHNIHVRNVSESVTVGSADCRVDPQTGNNLMVSNSKNVAICQMFIDNNLVLRGNTGRVMVRDNKVCTNIRVVDNDLIALRVKNNVYTVNFDLRRNAVAIKTVVQNNTEFDGTPAQCRRST